MKTPYKPWNTADGCTAGKIEELAPTFVKCISSNVSTWVEKQQWKELDSIINIIRSDEFYKDTLESWISREDDCESFDTDGCKIILNYDRFSRTPVRIDGKKCTQVAILYWK